MPREMAVVLCSVSWNLCVAGSLRIACTDPLQVKDPFNPDIEYPDASKPDDFALYEREVYNAILDYIFHDCVLPSQIGRLLNCGDGEQRIAHTDLLIGSFDGLEAGRFCACRGPTANHPYPTCLVHKHDLSNLNCTAAKRTTDTMRQAYNRAKAAPPRQQHDILADNGIHLIEVSRIKS